ncbi:MAG: glycosyltransferase [Clostridia bacterium]|nr:glycosyltransferase [Clostridia bacterium]
MQEKTIRVLQHMRVLDSGGIEAFVFANYKAMDRKKVIFDFLVTRDKEEFYDKEIKKLGGEKIILNFKKSKNSFINVLNQAKSFYKFCKENKEKYSVIHFQSIGANGFFDIIAAKMAGIPCRIAHSHIANDIKPAHNSNKKEVGKLRRMTVLLRQNIIRLLVSKNSTDFFGCSKMACEWMYTKKINKNKAIVVKNPIDVKKFKYNDNYRTEIRKSLNIENKYVIGHVGRFVYSKNHMFLLEQFAQFSKINEDAVLILVGGGILENEILGKIKSLGIEERVILYGETDSVYKLYSAFDVFWFPSVYEGLGIVLIEAQANGLPIIASSNIPSEVKITDNFYFVDINKKNEWIRIMKEKNICRNNDKNFEAVINSGYDIKDVSNFLQNFYINHSKRENKYENQRK